MLKDEDPNYIQKMAQDRTFFTSLEIITLAKRAGIGLNIIRTDEKYEGNEVLTLVESIYSLNLYFTEGYGGGKGNYGHYEGVEMEASVKHELN